MGERDSVLAVKEVKLAGVRDRPMSYPGTEYTKMFRLNGFSAL